MVAGDGSDTVAAVVAALVQAASRTAGAELAAFGPEIERVRQGLRRLPRWNRAAQQLLDTPNDPGAARALAEAVAELLDIDPELRDALGALRPTADPLPPPPAAPPSITFGADATIGGGSGQTAVGSPNAVQIGTYNKTTRRSGGTGPLIAVVAVATAAAAVSSYLGLGSGQQPGRPGHGVSALTAGQVQAALPDLHALPTGWRSSTPADVSDSPADCSGEPEAAAEFCRQPAVVGEISFESGGTVVSFRILAGPSRAWADTLYQRFLANSSDSFRAISIPAMGDASAAGNGPSGTEVLIEVGATVLVVGYEPKYPVDGWDSSKVVPFARMFTTRSQQAQDGETPTAVAE
ncbi:hypothetical protein [Kitasatospora sp. NPDC004531]